MVRNSMPDLSAGIIRFRSTQSGNPILKKISDQIIAEKTPFEDRRGLLFATDCLYFDRTSVQVRVHAGPHGEHITVSDDGGAFDRVIATGKRPKNVNHCATRIAKKYDLHASGGTLISPSFPIEEVSIWMQLIANASRDLGDLLLSNSEERNYRNIAQEIMLSLEKWYPNATLATDVQFIGASRKVHNFDIEIKTKEGIILIDELRPRRVNSIVAANFDVGRRTDLNLARVAVYDSARESQIGASNFSLVSAIATTVPMEAINKDFLDKTLIAA